MNNFDLERFNQEGGSAASNPQSEKPIPFDNGESQQGSVSRKPLSLGGAASGPAQAPTPKQTAPTAPVQKSTVAAPTTTGTTQIPKSTPANPVAQALATANTNTISGRITACKTFFAKLHAGALEFLGDQIAGWLEKNPHITIKQTNITVGEIQAKKTEPNLIIVIWY